MTENELVVEFNVFPNVSSVDSWYSKWYKTTTKWFPSPDEILEAGQKHIQKFVEEKIHYIFTKYKIDKSIVLDYNYSFCTTKNDDSWKSVGVGAGIAFVTSVLMGWAILPVTFLGAAVGGIIKRTKRIASTKESLSRISNEYATACAKAVLEILNFKKVSDLLNLPPAQKATQSTITHEKALTTEQLRIKNFLDDRGIKYLLHFTNSDNINSIKQHGLLSVEELKKRGILYSSNDSNRLDNELDYISLSVTSINGLLLGNYIHTGRIKNVRVIYISASILYEEINTPRIYCDRNAATSSCCKGNKLLDFENMFRQSISYSTTIGARDYNRQRDNTTSNKPTDPQAEILFKTCVPKKYIVDIRENISHYGY